VHGNLPAPGMRAGLRQLLRGQRLDGTVATLDGRGVPRTGTKNLGGLQVVSQA